MALEEATQVYERLEKAWNSRDIDTVGQLLTRMKLLLLNLAFLPTGKESHVDVRELILARNTLEIGALWSIEARDIPSFERYLAQVKCYYFDYNSELPDSAYKYHVLGLNLLSLLAQNRLAEFHTEMELLTVEEQKYLYIKHPISLEQFLMEGSYHKVFLSKGNVPAQNYNFFIDILIDTIKEEIASCAEKAYSQLSVREALKVLLMDSPQELEQLAEKRRWERDSTGQYFLFSQEQKKEDLHFIKNNLLITQGLGYARELEKIV